MTSKEALSSIAFSMKYRCSPKYVYKAEKENFTKIEKDLEVLEIIKKHYDEDSEKLSLGNFISFSIYSCENDFKKVKEWLENEKDN